MVRSLVALLLNKRESPFGQDRKIAEGAFSIIMRFAYLAFLRFSIAVLAKVSL